MSAKKPLDDDKKHKMPGIMNLFMPTCEEVSHLTSQSFDEKLSFRQKLGVKIHLMFCKWCRLYKKQLTQIRSLIKNDPLLIDTDLEKTEFNLSNDFKNRLKKSIEDNE